MFGGGGEAKRPSMFDPGSWNEDSNETKASSNPLFTQMTNITTSVQKQGKGLAARAGEFCYN